jgi:hypothetical protein
MRNYQRKKQLMPITELTPTQREWQRARQAEEQFLERFSAAEISSMSMSEFAALTGRSLHVAAPVPESVPVPVPEHAPEPVPDGVPEDTPARRLGTVSEAIGITVSEMDPTQYAQARERLGMGQRHEYGRGVLDGTAPGAWAAAARAKAGRSALVTSNVAQPPRIPRAYIEHTQAEGRASFYSGS